MTPGHFIFIPGTLLIGIAIGYALGARAVRNEINKAKKRAKE